MRYWSNCSYDFYKGVKGAEYLVYAGRGIEPHEVTVSKCGRTRLLEHAEEDLEVLGEGLPVAGGGAVTAAVLLQDEPVQFSEVRVPWVIAPNAAARPGPPVWILVALVSVAAALTGLGRLASRRPARSGAP